MQKFIIAMGFILSNTSWQRPTFQIAAPLDEQLNLLQNSIYAFVGLLDSPYQPISNHMHPRTYCIPDQGNVRDRSSN